MHKLNPRRLVFIDETWAKTNMTRTHGHRRRGERLVAKVCRTVATWRRIGTLLNCFTPAECANYLRGAGYASV